MWASKSDSLSGRRGVRLTFFEDARAMTVSDIIAAWRDHAGFRSVFIDALADVPYAEFRWETPAATSDSLSAPFECVVLDSPGLARAPESGAFGSYFAQAQKGVAVFPSLGRDATLVVPCPAGESFAYGHLAAFVRKAPAAQKHALWEAVGAVMHQRVGARPVWLSTAGAGVPWLHVRLDDRPKYYSFEPYRTSHAAKVQ